MEGIESGMYWPLTAGGCQAAPIIKGPITDPGAVAAAAGRCKARPSPLFPVATWRHPDHTPGEEAVTMVVQLSLSRYGFYLFFKYGQC